MSSKDGVNIGGSVYAIKTQTEEGNQVLESLSYTLQEMISSTLFTDQYDKLTEYCTKLQQIRSSMSSLSKRTQNMQLKLNKIREVYPQHQNALLQEGPFLYKCVWEGGIRYREYPKSDAKAKSKMVEFNESVVVNERVYITGENLVYLHVKGTGWLFENKDGITVMRICPMKFSKQDEDGDGEKTIDNPEVSTGEEMLLDEKEKEKETEDEEKAIEDEVDSEEDESNVLQLDFLGKRKSIV